MESDDEDLKRAIALSLGDENPGELDAAIDPLSNIHGSDSQDQEEDEELKAAIALSLKEVDRSTSLESKIVSSIIDITSDDEEDILVTNQNFTSQQRAQKQSNKNQSSTTAGPSIDKNPIPSHTGTPSSNVATPLQVPTLVTSGLGGLNRKQMEEERLARINQKRKRSSEPEDRAPAPHRQKMSTSESQSEPQTEKVATGVQYPNGVVKKTWAYGYSRTGDDIKIEEVIQRENLQLAVLSAFQIDTDWIASKLDEKLKVVWVLQAKTEAERQNWRSQAPQNYKFCFPSMEGNINCMHSKLQLLAYSTHLRVVVPSANLTPYDWGETGVMENICFLIDLPRLPVAVEVEELTNFGKELIYFTEALGIDRAIVDSIRRFDFSRTKDLAFVHSIGGNHVGSAIERTGYCGLRSAVRDLGFQTESSIEVDFVASSIGSLKDNFLKNIYQAAQGNESEQKNELTEKTLAPAASRQTSGDFKRHFRIYFPTKDTVAESKGGFRAGGTICLTAKFYDQIKFPRSLLRDCKSKRQGLLMHNKIMYIRGPSACWAYVGSHNLSESAWGAMTKDRKLKTPKFNLRNWECGVIFPATGRSEAQVKASRVGKGTHGWDVFVGRIPIPMSVPENDGSSELEYGDRKPWYFA